MCGYNTQISQRMLFFCVCVYCTTFTDAQDPNHHFQLPHSGNQKQLSFTICTSFTEIILFPCSHFSPCIDCSCSTPYPQWNFHETKLNFYLCCASDFTGYPPDFYFWTKRAVSFLDNCWRAKDPGLVAVLDRAESDVSSFIASSLSAHCESFRCFPTARLKEK